MHLVAYLNWQDKFRILVCGGRKYSSIAELYYAISCVASELGLSYEDVLIIHGGAKGADEIGGEWAHDLGVDCEVVHADWGQYGRAAGAVRNQKMLDDFAPHLVIAAPGGRGTADMKRRAQAECVEVLDLAGL